MPLRPYLAGIDQNTDGLSPRKGITFMSFTLLRNSLSRKTLFAGLLFLGIVGCGGGAGTGTITGKVSYKSTPLKGGRITFFGSDKKSSAKIADIAEDGTYKVEGVPVGTVKITVETEYLNQASKYAGKNKPPADAKTSGMNMPSAEELKRRYTAIPLEYSNPDQSELSFTVKKGNQEHSIDLTK
jgi:hypothetical protein